MRRAFSLCEAAMLKPAEATHDFRHGYGYGNACRAEGAQLLGKEQGLGIKPAWLWQLGFWVCARVDEGVAVSGE